MFFTLTRYTPPVTIQPTAPLPTMSGYSGGADGGHRSLPHFDHVSPNINRGTHGMVAVPTLMIKL